MNEWCECDSPAEKSKKEIIIASDWLHSEKEFPCIEYVISLFIWAIKFKYNNKKVFFFFAVLKSFISNKYKQKNI
jgi:hypothetical protein